jgi:hypothetical protein
MHTTRSIRGICCLAAANPYRLGELSDGTVVRRYDIDP